MKKENGNYCEIVNKCKHFNNGKSICYICGKCGNTLICPYSTMNEINNLIMKKSIKCTVCNIINYLEK